MAFNMGASPVELAPRATDSNIGSAQKPVTLSNFLSSLIPVALVAGIFFLLFLFLRRTQTRQYAPRTFVGSLRPDQRSPNLPNGLFNWFKDFFAIPDSFVLNHHSLDGFLMLRFLKIITVICLVGCFITWPVLLPVNATGGGTGKQFDLLSFSNVIKANKNRYYAHALISCIFFAFIMYMITREHIYFINLRQAYLGSPMYANRISSRTVLFASVPDEFLDEARIRRLFGPTVKNMWIATDCKELEELVKEREKIAMKLEGAETKLILLANKNHTKSQKKAGASQDAEASAVNQTTDADAEGTSGSVASRWVPQKKRPTHRLKFLIGKKVDTIDWCRSELQTLIPKIEALQATHKAGEPKYINSVFVEFIDQVSAQAGYQVLTHHQALHMSPRWIGVTPEEVIWSNLRIKWWERVVRVIATISFVVALVIFWSIPVAFVGALSNLPALEEKLPFLKFINKAPSAILGLITGLLPSILLAVLMALLPIILRLMAKLGGAPSLSRVELTVQNSYFFFQVIQVFLVTTLSSAAAASVSQIIKSPASTPSLLSQDLPKASNFYIAYFVLQGLTLSSGALLQIVGLIVSKILGKLLDSTPRKMYKRWTNLAGLGWGTVLPIYTNMAVIAVTYSCIAPLVLGFATVGLYLLYLANRYNLLFVNNANIDTRGLIYPRALQQMTVGVYLAQICLIGLFGINAAAGPLVIQVIFLIFCILYHVSLNSAFNPLMKFLPRTLDIEEEESRLLMEGGHPGAATSAGANGDKSTNEKEVVNETPVPATSRTAAPHAKPNFFLKWLRADKYTDYRTLRRMVPADYPEIVYDPEAERHAYYNPAISTATPLLWIPRDPLGVSRQEVLHTSKAIPISDEGAVVDAKNKIVWDRDVEPPIYEPHQSF